LNSVFLGRGWVTTVFARGIVAMLWKLEVKAKDDA
jgi:hypothetical protein